MPFITARVLSVVRDDSNMAAAEAGEDQSVLCASLVTLEGQILLDAVENHTFEWDQTSGTPVTLLNPNTLTPSFVNPQTSDIEFTLYVDRNTPFEDSDIVLITRRPQSAAATSAASSVMDRSYQITNAGNSPQVASQSFFDADAKVLPLAYSLPPATYSPIYTADDLDRIREWPFASYWLMNDIDLSSYSNWNPIGTSIRPFVGELQGNGFVIDNLTITSATKSAGLFSYVGNGALIEDVGMTNANISGVSSSFYKGIFAGSAQGAITIQNCWTEGTVASGGDLAGGFIGDTGTDAGSTFTNTYADVTVTGGGTDTGGWAGTFDATPTYVENYGNTTKTAAIVGTGSPGATEVSGLTTAQLTAEVNYTGWDFTDTWEIDEGVSPAVLQNTPSLIARTLDATCDSSMVSFYTQVDTPNLPNPFTFLGRHNSYKYKFIGTRTERLEGTNWVHDAFTPGDQRHIPIEDGKALRAYWRWDKTFNDKVIQTTETLHPRSFASAFGSSRPGGSARAATASVSSQSSQIYNLAITIQNPRKITKQVFEDTTNISSASTQKNVVDDLILTRYTGAKKTPTIPAGGNVTTNTSSASSYSDTISNLTITRNEGISIGGG